MSESTPTTTGPTAEELEAQFALPDATPAPFDPEQLEKSLQIQVVDMSSGAHANAKDASEEHINRVTTEGGFFKKTFHKIWHGNFARDSIALREQRKALNKITTTGELYAAQNGSQDDHDRAASAVVKRVSEGVLHEREVQNDLSTLTHGDGLQQGLKELIGSFADGSIDEAALKSERTRLMTEYGKHVKDNDRKKGLLLADNILDVARNAKAAFEHGVGLDRIDQALKAKHTEARMGVRTEAKLNAAEKITDKLYSTKFGSVLNEASLGAAVAIGVGISKWTTRSALRSGLTSIGIGLAVPGLVAGVRESFHIKTDRRSHMREMAEGGEGASSHVTGKRRESLEKTRYDTVSAQSLASELSQAIDLDRSDPNGLRAAALAIVNAQARIRMSDRDNVDRISFSGKTNVEAERTELDLTLARARAKVQDVLTDADEATLTAAGIDPANRNATELFDSRVKALMDGVDGNLEGSLAADMKAKDKAFSKLRNRRVLAAAATSFITSEIIGTGIQEIRASLDDTIQGVFEGQTHDQNQRTLLAGMFRHDGPSSTTNESLVAQPHNYVDIGHNVQVDVPKGYNLANHDGHWQLADVHGKVIDSNVGFNHDGTFNSDTQNYLTNKGFHFDNASEVVPLKDTITHTAVTTSPDQYMAAHPSEFTSVHRELWYDNNTPNTYDHNELGLWWGGQDNVGVDAQGNYVMSVAHMTPDGSWHEGVSADAQQLYQDHKMALALSVTQGTQNHVVMINFDANGNAIIPKDSFAGQGLFQMQDGHAQFVGAYAEAVQLGATNPDGSQNMSMLATVVGHGNPNNVTDTVTTVTHHSYTEVTNTLYAPILEANLPTEIVAGPGLYARGGLEYPKEVVGGYGYGYGYNSAQYWESWEKERSPRLRLDPNADLSTGEELAWYRHEQSKIRGEAYLSEIDDYISQNDTLKNIDDSTSAMVCIPVAAASESENIYRTLSMFARQDEEARDKTIVVLNLNWKESLESDADKMEKIQKTIAEVERARQDFPELKIAAFQKVWSEDFVQSKEGKIYGEVIKVLYDTAALAMGKAVEDGRRSADTEALLITNDADTLGMGRHYLQNYIKALNENPQSDVFSATIRRGIESYKDFPGYGVASEFYATLNMMTQRQQKTGNGGFTTEGPNSGIRMSTFAAVGGCEDRIGAGADAVLGQRISAARREPSTLGKWRRRVGLGKSNDVERKIGHYVGGAQIDTLPDRLLGAYRQGKWIARGWDQFDSGGYEDRAVSMSAGDLTHEDPSTDMDAIAARIETSIEGFASNWYRDPAVVSSTLAMSFGVNSDDTKLYDYTWDWSKSGDGAFKFHFTDEGKKQLQNRLMRDRGGRYDAFASRLNRQLYNRAGDTASKQPKLAEPRLLS